MEKPEKSFTCQTINWEQAFELARIIYRKIIDSGFKPDIIIGISRGGLVPARTLCDMLQIKDMTSIKMEHWGIAIKHKEALITQTLPIEVEISGKSILVVDDVADSGDSFQVVLQYLQEKHPLDIKTAVLHFKASSTFIPDYWGEKLEDWYWIVYPWAIYEDITVFIEKLLVNPMTSEHIRKELILEFNVKLFRRELNEILNDISLSGKIRQLKTGKKILWENLKEMR